MRAEVKPQMSFEKKKCFIPIPTREVKNKVCIKTERDAKPTAKPVTAAPAYPPLKAPV